MSLLLSIVLIMVAWSSPTMSLEIKYLVMAIIAAGGLAGLGSEIGGKK